MGAGTREDPYTDADLPLTVAGDAEPWFLSGGQLEQLVPHRDERTFTEMDERGPGMWRFYTRESWDEFESGFPEEYRRPFPERAAA